MIHRSWKKETCPLPHQDIGWKHDQVKNVKEYQYLYRLNQ